MQFNFDVAIIGAGPNGLCLAQALVECGLRIAVIERQAEEAIAQPAFDGREIALTHRSSRMLQELGIWQHIDPSAISVLRDAQVLNGPSLYAMKIQQQDGEQTALGHLVANYQIRQAAYQAIKSSPHIHLFTDKTLSSMHTDKTQAHLTLASGEKLQAALIVAADSRFSETRRMMGISANMHDFGKSMMVCVMEHAIPHQHSAWEWFDYGQTLALLPMNGQRSSVVITLAAAEMQALMQMHALDFNHAIEKRFAHRLGQMRLASSRHTYPLVTAYAERFCAQRFALVGDAAVGMHPVTAHGFNFGLLGIAHLRQEIKNALASGGDIASQRALLNYERKLRLDTRPLFLATHAIAKLYSDDSALARILRVASLRVANNISPIKRAIANRLAETH
jgi:ubiquinone biosynthesis UbiH/UbiF/VisC/COQ6 family hydroxylase